MSDRKFPVLGTRVPPLLGREAIMTRIAAGLTKRVPDHLQLVGPRFAGKTVILQDVKRRMALPGSPYSAVFLWDLGHSTPQSNEQFIVDFTHKLADAIAPRHAAYADHLRRVEGSPYKDVAEVLDALGGDGGRVLAILDGFDKPLSEAKLSRNLWDQLRELALKPSLRLITASRSKLVDLIRMPDSQTSDFWGIFDPTPVRVGCFDEEDLRAVLSGMRDFTFQAGAMTEFWNATNGFPVFSLEVLNVLSERHDPGEVSQPAMLQASQEALSGIVDCISMLWDDCPQSTKNLMWRVLKEGHVLREAGVNSVDADQLVERGFAQRSGSRLQRPSKLVAEFLSSIAKDGDALRHLFGNPHAYNLHLRGVLELRIEQLQGIDGVLRRYLLNGARDMPEHPDILISAIRGIVNQVFELIWKAELGEKRVPEEWIKTWEWNKDQQFKQDWKTNFPQGASRLGLLRLMTGTERSQPCAKRVTKNTYALMDAVYAFGDVGQHLEGVEIDVGAAYAALHICIELAAVAARELQTEAQPVVRMSEMSASLPVSSKPPTPPH